MPWKGVRMRIPSLKSTVALFKSAFSNWSADSAMASSAALAYYSVFSVAPLILIALAVSGLVFGVEAASNQIFRTFEDFLGAEGARGLQAMVESASKDDTRGVLATVIGVLTLVIGATSVFAQMQDSLNFIWKVRPVPGMGAWNLIRQRLLSFSLVLVIAFLLMVSLLLTAALSAIGESYLVQLPGGPVFWQAINLAASFGITVFLFGAIYKILPDVELRWRDVWSGALITSLLFTMGKWVIGLYLGKSGVSSSFGAAGAAAVFMLWVYYSSAVFFFGAELTRSVVLKKMRAVHPKSGSDWIFGPEHPRTQVHPEAKGIPPSGRFNEPCSPILGQKLV